MYDSFLADPRVLFAEEPLGIEVHWRDYTSRRTFSPKVWNDAYLAAFARVAGIDLITFDQSFSQYPGLTYTILS